MRRAAFPQKNVRKGAKHTFRANGNEAASLSPRRHITDPPITTRKADTGLPWNIICGEPASVQISPRGEEKTCNEGLRKVGQVGEISGVGKDHAQEEATRLVGIRIVNRWEKRDLERIAILERTKRPGHIANSCHVNGNRIRPTS